MITLISYGTLFTPTPNNFHTMGNSLMSGNQRFSYLLFFAVMGVHLLIALKLNSIAVSTTPQLTENLVTVELMQSFPSLDLPKPVALPARPNIVKLAKKSSAQPKPTPLLISEPQNFQNNQLPSPAVVKNEEISAQSPATTNSTPTTVSLASVEPSMPRFDADYLDNPKPIFPVISRRSGEEGKVMLRVYVEPSGLPSVVEIQTSSGYERLDQAAQNAIHRWKFIPAKKGTQAVGAWVTVPIVFSLKG